jgi:putative DNA primase/helicase
MQDKAKLSVYAQQLIAAMNKDIVAYKVGEDDLREKYRPKAIAVGLSDEWVDAEWNNAKRDRDSWERAQVLRKIIGVTTLPVLKKRQLSPPGPLTIKARLGDEVQKVKLNLEGVAEAEVIAEERKEIVEAREARAVRVTTKAPAPIVGFASRPLPTPSGLLLNPETPMENASAIQGLRAWHERDQVSTWRYWQKSFWQWDNGRWREVDEDTVRASIWHELNGAEKVIKQRHRVPFEPTPTHVNATLDALRALVNLDASMEMPGWFGDDQPNGEIREFFACANGILTPDRLLKPLTPKFWSPNVLDYNYDVEARAPRFERFLEEIWPDDLEAQQGLTELYGLCLTDVTDCQQFYMFIGPPRGGRGTMGRVLKGLIGAENYCGISFRAFGQRFGLEGLVGKKVAVITDMTLDGLTIRDRNPLIERIKQVTGEDDIDVDRKNKKMWHGKLTTRPIFYANEVPKLEDEGGALAERAVAFRMFRQFTKEQQDTQLTAKLLAERSGILNLALAGWDRLKARRDVGRIYIRQPASGLEMHESFADLGQDVARFVAECCVVGADHEILLSKLYPRWLQWENRHGIKHGWPDSQFSNKLSTAVPTIRRTRPRNVAGRPTKLLGIALREGKLLLLERRA